MRATLPVSVLLVPGHYSIRHDRGIYRRACGRAAVLASEGAGGHESQERRACAFAADCEALLVSAYLPCHRGPGLVTA
jgi:hypothetical protein